MSEQQKEVLLSPHAEAERLWSGAREAIEKARRDVVRLSESVDLGMRVVEILTIECLRTVRQEFPASVSMLLDSPPPDVDLVRDFVHPPKSLCLIDALDMLSDHDLSCISPQLHHGWVDRTDLCRDLRASTRRATGISLNVSQRRALMLIGAYRNRIFFLPPPVLIIPDEVLGAFPTLIELVEQLFTMERLRMS